MNINMIVAIQSKDNGIGFQGDQPYAFSEDFANFQKLTVGGIVIMGRKTWEAIPEKFRPLKERLNIVVTRQTDYNVPDGVLVSHSYEYAKELAREHQPEGRIWNIGGGELYKIGLLDEETTEIFLTRIMGEKDCDVFFPDFEKQFYLEAVAHATEGINRIDKKSYEFQFEIWTRI